MDRTVVDLTMAYIFKPTSTEKGPMDNAAVATNSLARAPAPEGGVDDEDSMAPVSRMRRNSAARKGRTKHMDTYAAAEGLSGRERGDAEGIVPATQRRHPSKPRRADKPLHAAQQPLRQQQQGGEQPAESSSQFRESQFIEPDGLPTPADFESQRQQQADQGETEEEYGNATESYNWSADEEDSSHVRVLFEEADVDHSGYLDQEEVKLVAEKLFCPAGSRRIGAEEAGHMFEEMDANADVRAAICFVMLVAAPVSQSVRCGAVSVASILTLGWLSQGGISYAEFAKWWARLGIELVPAENDTRQQNGTSQTNEEQDDEPTASAPPPLLLSADDLEDHKHEVTVVLTGILRDRQSLGPVATVEPYSGANSSTESASLGVVLYAFELKVFGVTVHKFFDRYSSLRAVHKILCRLGCIPAGTPLATAFPSKKSELS